MPQACEKAAAPEQAGGPCLHRHGSCREHPAHAASPLMTPFQLGEFRLSTRMVYAPLTRCRAIGHVPTKNAAIYYRQRTTPGQLLITEGTVINETGHGYPNTPGIYTAEQMEAWKPVVKAVHDAGGVIFMQIWHVGRCSHKEYQPNNDHPVGPSAVPIPEPSKIFLISSGEMASYTVPRALEEHEIQSYIQDYVTAAENAIKTGFDGVEIHGANGYLIEQFIRKTSNLRSDAYGGGSFETRSRFCLEVAKAVVAKVGAHRTGIRLSPYNTYLMELDDDAEEIYTYIVKELAKLKLLYIHCIEARAAGAGKADAKPAEGMSLAPFRAAWPGAFIAAGGFTRTLGDAAIQDGEADLVTYGRFFLSNPDLRERFVKGAALNHYDRNTFYIPDSVKGYIDYPTLAEIAPGHPTAMHYSGMKIFT